MIEELKPYERYQATDLPWARRLPTHWTAKRGKAVLEESMLPTADGQEIVTCFRDGQVTLRRNRRTGGFMMALYEQGYQGVRKGQLVVHAMDAFAGAIGICDSDGKCTPEYVVCNARGPSAHLPYIAQALRVAARDGFILASCPSVRERAPRFRWTNLGDFLVPLPPPEEQAAIVRFLDRANRRIDQFIRTKKKLIRAAAEARASVTDQVIRTYPGQQIRISSVATLAPRPVTRERGTSYTRLGLRNHGRGIFHKAPQLGEHLGDSDFFWVEPGDLVISGQFAWEGAIAIASEADRGTVVSHRYPVLRANPDMALTPYLWALLRSGYGELLLDVNSRGAAGRNRPLNERALMKEKIPVPPLEAQQQVANYVAAEERVRGSVERAISPVIEYRTRLIADVVTGQLDVRPAAASLPDIEPDVAPADTSDDEEADIDENEAA